MKYFINNRTSKKTRDGRKSLRRILDFLILIAVLWLACILAGRSLRQVAVAQLAKLTNAKIKAKSIDFNFDGSVFIEKLIITPDKKSEHDDAVLRAEKVSARFDIGSLLLVRPRLREITVNDFLFNAQYDLDARLWNTAGLKFDIPKGGAGQVPVVRLEKGTLQYSTVSKGRVKIMTKVPVDARFEPAEQAPTAYSFTITTAETTQAGKSTLNGSWQPGRITITGGISSEDVPSMDRAWNIKNLTADLNYETDRTYSLNLEIKDFLSSRGSGSETFVFDEQTLSENWDAFHKLKSFFRRFRPAGQIDVDLKASGNLEALGESQLSGKVYCKHVSIRDVKFPYLVQHIAGEIDFTEKGLKINNLSGDHEKVKLAFTGWSRDFGPDWQYEVRIKSDNMALDTDLYDALNPKQKKLWSAFSLSGLSAIDYTFSRHPRTVDKKSLKVRLLDAEATYENFPYPLKNLAGNLLFEADDITISDLVSQYNGREITLNGKVTGQSTDMPKYDVTISTKDVPLDSGLAAALPAKQRNFYQQFDMNGLADAEVKVFTPEPNAGKTRFAAQVLFKKASLKLEQLPLVINDISAKAVVIPNSIILEDFTGRYDQGTVSLTGQVWLADQTEKNRYCLKASAQQMELNEKLIKLLPESLKNLAPDWQVKGKINLNADLSKGDVNDCPDYKLTVDCLGNSLNLSFAKDVSNEHPANFKPPAYPLKDVTGRLIITTDSIRLDNITVTPVNEMQPTVESPTIKLNGEIELTDNALSSGKLALVANDILFDEHLGHALPRVLQDLYIKLVPTGTFDLKLENIKMSPTGEGQRNIEFVGNAKLKGCNLDVWPAVKEMYVILDMNGLYKTAGGFSDSRVSVFADSFKVGGKSVTSLKVDLNYNPRRRSWAADSFIADCYGGKLTGKFEFKQPTEGPSEYQLRVGFSDIDLKQFLSEPNRDEARFITASKRTDETQNAREQSKSNGTTSGKMSGSLSLRAGVGGDSSRLGRCRLIITDMYVGKPSPLAKLLYVLQLTDSKDFVFQRMFVDSYIKNDRLVFEKFDLSGESLAFNGSGSMDLKTKDVDLALTVRGKRLADAEPSVLQSLAEDIGSGVVRMDVTGNAYDPDVKIKTLPVIRAPLKILGKKTPKAD